MAERVWTLSPSDLTFLWEECPRCFYLKVAERLPRPRTAMPGIFGAIDGAMRERFVGRRTEEISEQLPAGVIEYGERWVRSVPLAVPGAGSACVLRGKFDVAARFDDGTFGLIDFKTSARRADHIPWYGRQLHAYAHALENAADGALALAPVSTLGLLVFEPDRFDRGPGEDAVLHGGLSWIPIPRDDDGFLAFLGEVLRLLERPAPPEPAPACPFCQYREAGRRSGL